jgi:hypothetical protein
MALSCRLEDSVTEPLKILPKRRLLIILPAPLYKRGAFLTAVD